MQSAIKYKNEPPKLIPSFVAGFQITANHLQLLVFPFMLDMFFWFGPIIRIREILSHIFIQAVDSMAGTYSSETMALLIDSQYLWDELLKNLNVLFTLRTFPIGIPSLMISNAGFNHPLGPRIILEITSITGLFFIILALLVLGVFIGALFFQAVANQVGFDENGETPKPFYFGVVQSLIMTSVILFFLILVLIPTLCFISSVTVFLPSLGSIPFFVVSLIIIWVLTPLVYTPHGIFLNKQKFFNSISISNRMVRSFIPNTGFFFLVAMVISYGLDILWATPNLESWFMFIGIFGHAFISTAIISATFVYYRTGFVWMQEVLSKREQRSEDTAVKL